ncbi:hypothetical protein B9Z36_08380 [Limnohabitans sp. Rim8]|uniref:DUF3304 domain-containing protein n=1 Tax=Limnohabitans sp. Rim8 TaxID=1100718 RepID=UPI000D3B013B|nr:DUF3304 domain-containing protein [Limnohabitans sp. Rim8]PUE57002.1 hypothetical protein B9Z36_08380 [Limnohabitans sp. Rim8]
MRCEMNVCWKWLRVFVLLVAPFLVACASPAGEDTVGTSVSGVGHYGKRIGVADFFVNGQWAGAVTGWGGGGGNVCCASLPRHPDKPVMVTVKWRTIRSNVGEEAWHEQTVSVNFAEKEPGYMFVHFLPGHRVEVWSSARLGPGNPNYAGPAYPRDPAPDYAPLPNEKPQPNAEVKP